MLKFTPFKQHQPGLLYGMLTECYSNFPELVKQEKKSWSDYDASVFANPETIGKCGFVSTLKGKPIGFASWDPRNHPECIVIGHNCVIPRYQKHGFGRLQVNEMLKRFKAMGFAQVKVSTGDDPFFLPAQKMYISCGFQETSREPHQQIPGFSIICYIKQLVKI